MKFLIVISFLILVKISVIGQFDYDTVLLKNRVIETLDEGYEDIFEKEHNKMMSFAISKINKDSIYIPIYSHNHLFSKTSIKILMKEYGFVYENIVEGDLITSPIYYFEEIMIEAVKQKFGINFLDSIKQTSDSLDKIGMGYISSSFNFDTISLFDYFILKGIDKSILMDRDNTARVVSFQVNKDGSLSQIKYYEGIKNIIMELKEVESELKVQFLNAINEMPKWKTAYLKGKPISETNYINISPFILD